MLVHQTTPFTSSTAVPMSAFQRHLNDMDVLITLPEAPFINKASDSSTKPWKAQPWWLEIEMQPAKSPVAQPPVSSPKVVKNAPSATTTPAASVTQPTQPKPLAQLAKTFDHPFSLNTHINSSWEALSMSFVLAIH